MFEIPVQYPYPVITHNNIFRFHHSVKNYFKQIRKFLLLEKFPDTLTGDAAKWNSCIEDNTDYNGADIAGAQSYGFGTEWDCMGWCLNTANCMSVTYRQNDGHCWLKNKPKGNSQHAYNGLTSISLECMRS